MPGNDSPADADRPRTTPGDVRRTYDRIAGHFAATREHPWPEVTSFLDDHDGRTGLDLGCGNGRHLPPLLDRSARAVGLDLSGRLLGIAADELPDSDRVTLVQAEATRLPLAGGTVDLGLYVATLGHLPGRQRRLASLDELARVLSVEGRALVSAWSTAHDRFDRTAGFDTTVDWTLPDGEVVPRYYHVYAPAEFERDLADTALRLEDSFVSSGNCYAVVSSGSGTGSPV